MSRSTTAQASSRQDGASASRDDVEDGREGWQSVMHLKTRHQNDASGRTGAADDDGMKRFQKNSNPTC